MRIVLDTNIFASALISRDGPPGRVLAEARRGHLRLVTSMDQIAELRRVLDRPRLGRFIPAAAAQDLLGNLEQVAEVVTDLPDIEVSPDPDDNRILATAVAGRADLIVSGDKKDMVALGEVEGIPIVTAAAAAERTRRRRP